MSDTSVLELSRVVISPALSFDKTPQRTLPSTGFHGGTLGGHGSKKPLGHRSLPRCRRVADGAGTPCLLPNRFGKLAASSIHYQSPERTFISGARRPAPRHPCDQRCRATA